MNSTTTFVSGLVSSLAAAVLATHSFGGICSCASDVNDDNKTDGSDLALLMGAWGTSGGAEGALDLDHNGIVDGSDLAIVLGSWGPCSFVANNDCPDAEPLASADG